MQNATFMQFYTAEWTTPNHVYVHIYEHKHKHMCLCIHVCGCILYVFIYCTCIHIQASCKTVESYNSRIDTIQDAMAGLFSS